MLGPSKGEAAETFARDAFPVPGFLCSRMVREGWLHEYMVHECLKSSLAFRQPAVAAASRRPARADGPKVGPAKGRYRNFLACGA